MAAYCPARAADLPALAALYRDAARAFGPAVYTPEQVAAWCAVPDDAERFARWILDADTELALDAAGAPVGFCGVDLATGHVQSLYVRAGHERRGIGGALLARALARAGAGAAAGVPGGACGSARQEAWVTPFSCPVFLRAGFRLVETVQAPFNGVMFERYRVERP